MRTPLRPYILAAATVLWLAATAAGLARLTAFGQTAGDTGVVPDTWPAAAGLSRAATTATLVLALHPACTCSQATLDQLDALLAAHPGTFDVVVLLARYDALPAGADVIGPALARRPSLRRVDDPEAAIARRFGALTSGHALLYDQAGRLRFSGGLTRARGETGDSAPLAWLRGWAAGTRPPGAVAHRVFGCALAAHEDPS